jgi:tetratricopeptide (TPR) repeat protein
MLSSLTETHIPQYRCPSISVSWTDRREIAGYALFFPIARAGVKMKRNIATSLVVLMAILMAGIPAFAQDAPAPVSQVDPAAPAAPTVPVVPLIPAAPAPEAAPSSLNLLAFFTAVPDATMAVLRTASGLADSGKWASAFKTLQDFDPANADPFVLALKTEIAMKGNAQTYMHVVFAFVDLEPGKDLATARMVGAENAEPIDFDPGILSAAMEAAGASLPPVLYKVLGDYYFEVLTNYSGQWVDSDEAVSLKILENYERAIAGEAYDEQTLFRQGEVLLQNGNNEAAGTVLGKYLALKPEDAQARFAYAKSLAANGSLPEAYAEINKLIGSDIDPQLKNDIYMFAIQTAVSSEDAEKTESYLTAMQNENPDDTIPGLIRHLLSIRSGQEEAAAMQADSLLSTSQGDPNVVRSLVSSWLSEEKPDPAFAFLARGIVRHAEKPQILATLYFYKSLLRAEVAQSVADFETALVDMDAAEANFKLFLEPENEVFATIADLRDKIRQSMESPAPATTEPAPAEADATSAASEPE